MSHWYYPVYHALIVASIMLSFVAWKRGRKRFLPILLVLLFTEGVELFAHYASTHGLSFVWAYHCFVFIEFGLFSWYFMLSFKARWLQGAVIIAVLLFTILGLVISIRLYRFQGLPGLNISLEGLFLSVYSCILLFNIEVKSTPAFFRSPDTWIALGLLVFFGGTFFFNGIYTSLVSLDRSEAMALFGLINMPLNLFMYSCILIGLICLTARRKPILR